MTPSRAASELGALRRFFKLLPYTPEVLETWQRIVIAQGIAGKQTHDAHIVAVMQVHSVTQILTFNGSHFGRFPGIGILDPTHVIVGVEN